MNKNTPKNRIDRKKKKYIRNRLIDILREGMRECYIQIGVLNHHGEMLFSA